MLWDLYNNGWSFRTRSERGRHLTRILEWRSPRYSYFTLPYIPPLRVPDPTPTFTQNQCRNPCGNHSRMIIEDLVGSVIL